MIEVLAVAGLTVGYLLWAVRVWNGPPPFRAARVAVDCDRCGAALTLLAADGVGVRALAVVDGDTTAVRAEPCSNYLAHTQL